MTLATLKNIVTILLVFLIFSAHLGSQLEEDIKTFPNVKLIRQEERIGLTKAKIIGAKIAQGQVLVFLDSHCECHDGWLEPLLYGIYLNPRIAITPVIFVIRYGDFGISSSTIDYANIGVFNFKMEFNWQTVPMTPDMILKSPTMAGGLFAIDKDFFFESGAYDDGMGFWGGENLEMSFRLWTCAEGIYINSCSLVGHVFRDKSPHHLSTQSIIKNKLRVVQVWLDEYKEAFYKYYPSRRTMDFGDISERIELRKKLNCQSFQWYLDNIATMVRIPEQNPAASGYIVNMRFQNLCFDSFGKEGILKLKNCHKNGGNQYFVLTKKGEIESMAFCLDNMGNTIGSEIEIKKCHSLKGNQEWFHQNVNCSF